MKSSSVLAGISVSRSAPVEGTVLGCADFLALSKYNGFGAGVGVFVRFLRYIGAAFVLVGLVAYRPGPPGAFKRPERFPAVNRILLCGGNCICAQDA